jgi:two-component system response regulator MprA
MAKILVVDDDEDLLISIRQTLKAENHTIETVSEGNEALNRMQVYDYDLAILDWGLPDIEGIELCKRYRQAGGKTLILMLTGKASVSEKEAGLDAGADDYLSKPFNIKELNARVRSLLRRAGSTTDNDKELQIADIKLNAQACRVTKDGKELSLSRKELLLLQMFMSDPNRVYSVDVLLRDVWNDTPSATPATVRTHIKTLRQKIDSEGQPTLIDTVHGVGYRLRGKES